MPAFDMLPAVYPTDFPQEKGSFKPFMHTRLAAVAGAGLYVNHAVFENPDLIPIQRDEGDIFQNCCASFSLDPFPQASRYYINVTCDIYGGFLATLCDGAEIVDDLGDLRRLHPPHPGRLQRDRGLLGVYLPPLRAALRAALRRPPAGRDHGDEGEPVHLLPKPQDGPFRHRLPGGGAGKHLGLPHRRLLRH